jgi:PAS domain S-box-containing protein
MSGPTDTLAETLSAFETVTPGKPLTTDEVAERLGLDRLSAAERLHRLADRQIIETRRIGAEGRVWWQPPDESTITLTMDLDSDAGDGHSGAERRRAGANTIPADEILDTAEVGVFVLDSEFDVVWANAAIERYFGLDRAEAIHRDKRELVDERIASVVEDSAGFAETVLATYDDNSYTEQFECYVTADEDRDERWLEHRSTPIEAGPYAGGRIEVYYDITDRKRAHDESQLLSAVSRSIAEAESLEGGLQAALADVCEWTDWEVGQAWLPTDEGVAERLSPSHETAEVFAPFERASRDYTFGPGDGISGRVLETGEPVWFPDVSAVSEDVYPRTALAADVGLKAGLGVPVISDGEVTVILEFYMTDRREASDRLVETVTSVAAELGNLVARRQSEAAHRRETELTDRILETSPVGIAVFDADRDLERANERLAELFGPTLDSAEEYTVGDMPFFDADGEPLAFDERPASRVSDTGDPVTDQEVQIRPASGERRWLSINATPITDETGEIVRIVATVTDITRLKEQARRLEQRRADLETELEEVFDRIDDAFYALDDEWRFTYVNDRAEEFLNRSESELLGRTIWEALSISADDPTRERFETVLTTQEPQRVERFFDPLDIWTEFRIYPSESGLSVYLTDITERKEREQRLEQYRAMTQAAQDVIITIDETSTIHSVNPAVEDVFGYTPADLRGKSLTRLMPEELSDQHLRAIQRYLDTGERHLDWDYVELPGQHKSGEEIPIGASFSETETDGTRFFTGIVRDITERKQRERELEQRVRQQEVVAELGERALEDPDLDALLADATEQVAETLDSDYCKVLDLDADAEELLLRQGVGWDERAVGSATVSADESDSQAAATLSARSPVVVEDLATEGRFDGSDLLTSHGVRSGISTIIGPPDDPWGTLGVYDTARTEIPDHDVTFVQSVANILATAINRYRDRRELARRREQLRDRASALSRAYEVVADPERSFSEQVDALLGMVRETVGTDYAALSHVVDEEYVFEYIDGPADADLAAGDTVALEATNCERVVATERTLVLNDVERDAPGLADRRANADWGISCYLGAPIVVDGDVYGTFCFYDLDARTEAFSDWEVMFVELLSNWVSSELERQQHTDQLEALNDLNDIVREITDAAIEEPTREEIEQIVCERLVETRSYRLAWIGESDISTQTVDVRTGAGAESYLDDVTISLDSDDEQSEGPTSRAFRTGEIQTIQDIQTDPRYEPWRETAETYEFQSSAAIPIVHEETVYGVLNVYAERPYAFEGQERQVLGQLGEMVGHAIAAAERKQALMSDEVVEVEFRIPRVFEALDADVATDGRITFDRTVPIGDGEYLMYGTAAPDAVDDVRTLVEALPYWRAVSFIDEEREGDRRFELRLAEPPVLEAVAARGGSIEEGIIENRDYRMGVHLPPSVDVREIIDIVEETYPTVDMVSRQQISLDDPTREWTSLLSDGLTDRQLSTLEIAYHSGYFNWPRDATAEDIADSLGVSSPTVHKHLRAAQQKVFGAALSEPTG